MAALDPALQHAVLGLVVDAGDLFDFLGRVPNFVSAVQAAEPQPDDSAILVEGAERLADEDRVLARLLLAWPRPGRDVLLLALPVKLYLSCFLLLGPRDLGLSRWRLHIVVFRIRIVHSQGDHHISREQAPLAPARPQGEISQGQLPRYWGGLKLVPPALAAARPGLH